MTGANVPRLAAIDNIVGIKEASGNIAQMAAILNLVPDEFVVLSGDDAITLPLIALGGRGVISVVSNDRLPTKIFLPMGILPVLEALTGSRPGQRLREVAVPGREPCLTIAGRTEGIAHPNASPIAATRPFPSVLNPNRRPEWLTTSCRR